MIIVFFGFGVFVALTTWVQPLLQSSGVDVRTADGLLIVLTAHPGRVTGYVALGLFGLVLLPALPILLELIEHRTPEQAGTATALLWLSGHAGGLVMAVAVGTLTGRPAVDVRTGAAPARPGSR